MATILSLIPVKQMKCPICNETLIGEKNFSLHLLRKHKRKIVQQEIDFGSIEEFITWKSYQEESTNSSFKQSGKKKTDNGFINTYCCSRSSSNKIEGTCPARITMYQYNDKSSVKVTFTSTHVGHDTTAVVAAAVAVKEPQLSESQKNIIKEKLYLKIPDIEILTILNRSKKYGIKVVELQDIVDMKNEMKINTKGNNNSSVVSKPSKTFTEPSITVSCDICCEKFFNVPSLRSHYEEQHSVKLVLNKRRSYVCPVCRQVCANRTYYYMHLSVTHFLTFTGKDLEFDNVEEFKKWKKEEETNTNSCYVGDKNHHELDFIDCDEKFNDSNNITKTMYLCNLSKTFRPNGTVAQPSGTKLPKIDATCPAFIFSIENTETGKVTAKFYSNHYGHGDYKRYGPGRTKIDPKSLKEQNKAAESLRTSKSYCSNGKLLWQEHSYSFVHPDETPIPIDVPMTSNDNSDNDCTSVPDDGDDNNNDDDDSNDDNDSMAVNLDEHATPFGPDEYNAAVKSITDPDIDQILDRTPTNSKWEQVEINNLVNHSGSTNLVNHSGSTNLVNHSGSTNLVNHCVPTNLVNHFVPNTMVNQFIPTNLVNHYGYNNLVNPYGYNNINNNNVNNNFIITNTNANNVEQIRMENSDIENYAQHFRRFWSAANVEQKALFNRIAFDIN